VQPAKTLWDLLQLLIVPAFLVWAVTLYTGSQTAEQNRQSLQAAQDSTLDAYVLQMSDLMLKDKLLHRPPGSAVVAVATALTGQAIGRLDRGRQIEVARFLSGAHVKYANLAGADLSGIDFDHAHLVNANLYGANLNGAILDLGKLEHANLTGPTVNNVVRGAHLEHADLNDADLRHADLIGADLSGATLLHAKLAGAYLSDAHLAGTDLSHANLVGAHISGADLSGAKFDHTTCPNGTITNTGCGRVAPVP